jgi:hypothetical protein
VEVVEVVAALVVSFSGAGATTGGSGPSVAGRDGPGQG